MIAGECHGPERARLRSVLRAIAAAAAACLMLSVSACAPAADAPPRDGLSLVWISLDTLRADHVSLYGYERETTPLLDALAHEGAYVKWAVTPQTATLPTHVTQFTGHHPVVHGVMHCRLPQPCLGRRRADRWALRLRTGLRALRRHLLGVSRQARVGGRVHRGSSPEERFFVFVQTYEIHSPYSPPPPDRRRFVTPGERHLATRSLDLYDGSIRFADDALRDFVADLALAERLDSTVLVVTGDHGEHFAEYGVDVIGHHGQLLRPNLTRVPWIVRHPDPRMHARVVDTAGLVGFANTPLSLLGLAERLPGGGRPVFDETPAEVPVYLSWAGPTAWSL